MIHKYTSGIFAPKASTHKHSGMDGQVIPPYDRANLTPKELVQITNHKLSLTEAGNEMERMLIDLIFGAKFNKPRAMDLVARWQATK